MFFESIGKNFIRRHLRMRPVPFGQMSFALEEKSEGTFSIEACFVDVARLFKVPPECCVKGIQRVFLFQYADEVKV